jgi:putative transposase
LFVSHHARTTASASPVLFLAEAANLLCHDVRGWQKTPVGESRDLVILRDEWAGLSKRHGWAVGSYVVMPDHVHFFMTPVPTEGTPLNQAVGKWKEWTAKRIFKACGGVAPLWQPEFFDHLLRSKESLAEKWIYVRNNPVRAGPVSQPNDWPYAGAIDFA